MKAARAELGAGAVERRRLGMASYCTLYHWCKLLPEGPCTGGIVGKGRNFTQPVRVDRAGRRL